MSRHYPHMRSETLSMIRAYFLNPWVRELKDAGGDVEAILAEHHLQGSRLLALYEEVQLRDFIRFTESLSELLGRDFLGLEIADASSMTDLGPVYILTALAKNLRVVLSSLARCQTSWQSNTVLDLLECEDFTGFRYAIQDPAIWPRRQDAEFVLATVAKIVRARVAPNWRPARVEFEHDIGARADQLSRWFGAPVVGNCASNVIYIANEDMDRPLRTSTIVEDDIVPLVERHLLELMRSFREPLPTWAAKVDFLLGRRLGWTDVKIEHIAAELNTSARSLRRHLAGEGTSFRALLRERRKNTVVAVLQSEQSESMKLKSLAYRLNYSDSATLSRAYKSWTGGTPSSLRVRTREIAKETLPKETQSEG